MGKGKAFPDPSGGRGEQIPLTFILWSFRFSEREVGGENKYP
jgi:hypothetical protein